MSVDAFCAAREARRGGAGSADCLSGRSFGDDNEAHRTACPRIATNAATSVRHGPAAFGYGPRIETLRQEIGALVADEGREAQEGTNPARDPARLGLPQLADEVDVLGLVLEEHGVHRFGEATPLTEVEPDR